MSDPQLERQMGARVMDYRTTTALQGATTDIAVPQVRDALAEAKARFHAALDSQDPSEIAAESCEYIPKLESRIAELERDAGRWQFAKRHFYDEMIGVDPPHGCDMDSAIDALMKAEEEGK